MRHRGLALIIVIGILGVLAVLAAAFVMMAQLERRASEQRVNAARAYLLARSGIEDALARLELGQDSSYGGENWDGSPDGLLSSYEAGQEVHHRTGEGTLADVAGCPVRHAMRPSFFAGTGSGGALGSPAVVAVEGRDRGYSGLLRGEYAERGNSYALKVQTSNAGIFINGGALDTQDRDPDGPGAKPEDFPLNPNAAAEVAPLLPNHVPDHKDVSMEGPNGFLVRLLNNLDAVVTNEATSHLGVQIVGSRPVGGFKSLDELKPVLGPIRYERFKPYLTLHAWVDPKVVKPQPMDGRPHRWEDIDDSHRIGAEAQEISGVHADSQVVTYAGFQVTGLLLTLNPGISGNGREADPAKGDAPWIQTVTATNSLEKTVTYPVSWERNFIYAWSQLRLAPVAREPRAPVSIEASQEVLAAVLRGLQGTTLEVWDGSAGWEGGFGWYRYTTGGSLRGGYAYPARDTEESPWIRTRVDYGMTYGNSTFAPSGRPWYGPGNYNPHASDIHTDVFGNPWPSNGKPLILSAPLGRLRETEPISAGQAQAVARQLQRRIAEAGAIGTWERFNAFVDALPRWEDLNDDGKLDGDPYPVVGGGGIYNPQTGGADYMPYTRRIYRREDLDSDGRMRREVFTPLLPPPVSSWKLGVVLWQDSGLTAGQKKADLPAGKAPGLTFTQRDVLKAMANPNTDLNDFNPDANLFKEVDKTDLLDHTTELALDKEGIASVRAAGRVTDGGGRLLAEHRLGAVLGLPRVRHTTQADFMQPYAGGRPLGDLSAAPYAVSGGQPLVSYPEPMTVWGGTRAADAAYDGQIGLGFIAPGPGPGPGDTLRGALFDTVDAVDTQDKSEPDLRGPRQALLVTSSASPSGSVFPDGVYSEKDRALKYSAADNIRLYYKRAPGALVNQDIEGSGEATVQPTFYVGCWAKPNWFPEASPRAHAFVSLSMGAERVRSGKGWNSFDVRYSLVPLDDILAHPVGLYFVPARNNAWEDAMGPYQHSSASTRGAAWPRRALIWGTVHSFFASDCLNRGGLPQTPPGSKSLGRLEAHRWQHLAMVGGPPEEDSLYDVGGVNVTTALFVGRTLASPVGGGWNFGGIPVLGAHVDGTPNHLRFGEISAEHNMNYVADATFANVRAGKADATLASPTALLTYKAFFMDGSSPASLGRYLKHSGATFTSAKLPAGIRPTRITWTEIPCDLWFDEDGDGWLGDATGLYKPKNDQFTLTPAGLSPPVPNGKRDVHIEMEVWFDMGTDDPRDDLKLARFDDPAANNRIPEGAGLLPLAQPDLPAGGDLLPPDLFRRIPQGRMYYKAVFVNEWDEATRLNHPLDVTPFLDDVTIEYQAPAGPRIMAYETAPEN